MYPEKGLNTHKYQSTLWSLSSEQPHTPYQATLLLTKEHIQTISPKGNNPKVPGRNGKKYKAQDLSKYNPNISQGLQDPPFLIHRPMN